MPHAAGRLAMVAVLVVAGAAACTGSRGAASSNVVEVSRGRYAEIESLAPGTTRAFHLVLARGSYALTCLPEDSDAETGPAVTVTDGPAVAGTASRAGGAVPPPPLLTADPADTSGRVSIRRESPGARSRGRSPWPSSSWVARRAAHRRRGS